jgi:hypothetical protein
LIGPINARIIGVKNVDHNQNKKFRDYAALITWMRRRGRFWQIEFATQKHRRITLSDISVVKLERRRYN